MADPHFDDPDLHFDDPDPHFDDPDPHFGDQEPFLRTGHVVGFIDNLGRAQFQLAAQFRDVEPYNNSGSMEADIPDSLSAYHDDVALMLYDHNEFIAPVHHDQNPSFQHPAAHGLSASALLRQQQQLVDHNSAGSAGSRSAGYIITPTTTDATASPSSPTAGAFRWGGFGFGAGTDVRPATPSSLLSSAGGRDDDVGFAGTSHWADEDILYGGDDDDDDHEDHDYLDDLYVDEGH
jgi:hypothetical protein